MWDDLVTEVTIHTLPHIWCVKLVSGSLPCINRRANVELTFIYWAVIVQWRICVTLNKYLFYASQNENWQNECYGIILSPFFLSPFGFCLREKLERETLCRQSIASERRFIYLFSKKILWAFPNNPYKKTLNKTLKRAKLNKVDSSSVKSYKVISSLFILS